MFEFLKSILSDHSGGGSTTRLAFLLFIVCVSLVWSTNSIRSNTILDVPSNVVWLVGLLGGAKVLQRYGEKDVVPPQSS